MGVPGLTTTRKDLRNQTVLAVAAPLLKMVRGLNTFTRKTSNLSERAMAVRAAILNAREPDQLLLVDLPAACGFSAASWARPTAATINAFADELHIRLEELGHAYEAQLQEVRDLIAEAFDRRADVESLREAFRVRAEPLDGKILDPKLQTFIFNATDDTTDPEGWLGRIGLAVTGKSVELWLDEDRQKFRTLLMELAAAFHRVEALHTDLKARSFEGSFTARRLTLTTPEGDEKSRVLYYDNAATATLTTLVERMIGEAEELAGGPQGRDGLTALLVERVLRITADQQIGMGSKRQVTRTRRTNSGS